MHTCNTRKQHDFSQPTFQKPRFVSTIPKSRNKKLCLAYNFYFTKIDSNLENSKVRVCNNNSDNNNINSNNNSDNNNSSNNNDTRNSENSTKTASSSAKQKSGPPLD